MSGKLEINATVAVVLALAGALSTGLGGAIAVLQRKPSIDRVGTLQACAAGVMFAISFFDLLPEAMESIGTENTIIWFCGGVLFFASIAHFVPDPEKQQKPKRESKSATPAARTRSQSSAAKAGTATTPKSSAAAFKSGLIVALGIGLHNMPEGMAVCLSSLQGFRFGIPVTVAIALHNIPEGMAVALPIFAATSSRWQAFLWALVSGLAEPLGVILVVIFKAQLAHEWLIHSLLAAVAGIMVYLSVAELLPYAFKHSKKSDVIKWFHIGLFAMLFSLVLLHRLVPDAHGHSHGSSSNGAGLEDADLHVDAQHSHDLEHNDHSSHDHAGHSQGHYEHESAGSGHSHHDDRSAFSSSIHGM
eukprot:TRINITY_DN574_c0_g1_i1.p1 TRINITY_DN574_c0_g1~~TRINITY_DN574_c0_g1_i1.p1  ORF type:complete len:360 (+),score=54.22 TRINITY_DN574_c0_g1_i1:76-1155(+)